MNISQKTEEFEGKTIAKIQTDSGGEDTFYMVEKISIEFTDGTTLHLKTDWRGQDCYISQYEKD